jgi:hypothetical protein
MTADGNGCYAWPKGAAQWGIANPGSNLDDGFRAEGERRVWGQPDAGEGIELNLATGKARFVRQGRTTRGEVVG